MLSFFGVLKKPIDILSNFSIITSQFYKLAGVSFVDERIKSLNEENQSLNQRLSDYEKLKKENASLMDQFRTTNDLNQKLIPANVVGAPGFVPGLSSPEFLIINRGEEDGVLESDAVVYKNNVVGLVDKIYPHLSKIRLITNSKSSFTVKVGEKGILGVSKGQGEGTVVVDNVLLSEEIKEGDVVLTGANKQEEGVGLPPNLIVGRIQSVDKIPSALFQQAEVKQLFDVSKIDTVFILKN